MHHWLQLAGRDWSAKPGRTAIVTAAIALGVGVVVWVTCCYESVKQTLEEQMLMWIGRSHLAVESPLGHWGSMPAELVDKVRQVPNVKMVSARFRRRAIRQRPHPASRSGAALVIRS